MRRGVLCRIPKVVLACDVMVSQPFVPPDARCRKVAFIGSHGVGKTTLTYELAARLKRANVRVELVKEVARRCPLPLNRETTLDAQAWILHTQMALEIESTRGHEVVVCDRSALDNYASAYALTKDPQWLAVAKGIAGYVEGFMTSREGGFFTTQDADLNAHDRTKPYMTGHEYYAKGDAERRAEYDRDVR